MWTLLGPPWAPLGPPFLLRDTKKEGYGNLPCPSIVIHILFHFEHLQIWLKEKKSSMGSPQTLGTPWYPMGGGNFCSQIFKNSTFQDILRLSNTIWAFLDPLGPLRGPQGSYWAPGSGWGLGTLFFIF